MEDSFNTINQGLNVNFDHGIQLTGNVYPYSDGMKNDILDGITGTGSLDTLLNNDTFNYIQKSSPKIIFDYGTYSGFTDFEYIIIPCMYTVGTYGVYALTNNKTKLQLVAAIICNGHTNGSNIQGGTYNGYGSIHKIEDPMENYTPHPNGVESITVNGIVYTYSGCRDNLDQMGINNQTGQEVITQGYRNPDTGYGAYIWDDGYGQWNEIEDVTLYSGITPPIE